MSGGSIVGSSALIGVTCISGGQAQLQDVEIADCSRQGILSVGAGSKVVVRGGRIRPGPDALFGVLSSEGAHAEVRDVVITGGKFYGLADGFSGTLVHSGCTVTGCLLGAYGST